MAENPGYPALIHGGDFGASCQARIRVSDGMLLVFVDGTRALTLDFGTLEVVSIGSSVGLHDAGSDISISTSQKATISHLIDASPVLIAEDLQALRKQLSSGSLKTLVIGGMIGVLLLVLVFWFVLPSASPDVISLVPIEVDVELGELVIGDHLANDTIHQGPRTREALRSIVASLAPHAANVDFNFQINILKEDSVNAFAVPGGIIHIHRGLIDAIEDPSELIGVIAHEISHVTLRHGIRTLIQEIGVNRVAELLIASASDRFGTFLPVISRLRSRGYSRHLELEADDEAVRMLHEARLPTSGLVAFLSRLEAERKEQPAVIETVSGWDSTHPELQERIALIEEATKVTPGNSTNTLLEIDLEAIREEIHQW